MKDGVPRAHDEVLETLSFFEDDEIDWKAEMMSKRLEELSVPVASKTDLYLEESAQSRGVQETRKKISPSESAGQSWNRGFPEDCKVTVHGVRTEASWSQRFP